MINIEKQWLEAEYWGKGRSLGNIGVEFGVGANAIWVLMKRLGIPRRGKGDMTPTRGVIHQAHIDRENNRLNNTWRSRYSKWGEWKIKTKISKEELEDLYLNGGLTLREMGEKLGVSWGTVMRKLKDFGIARVRFGKGKKCPHRKRTYPEMMVIWGRRDTSGRSDRLWRAHARKVWEYYYDEKLTRNDAIHHIDGNVKNCDIGNLQKMSRSEHAKMHMKNRKRDNGRLC